MSIINVYSEILYEGYINTTQVHVVRAYKSFFFLHNFNVLAEFIPN